MKRLDHPLAVYVRESAIVPKLDEWIGTLFDPANLDETCEALAMAGGATEADHARIEAANRKLEWAGLHGAELAENWERAKSQEPLVSIEPLP